MFHQRFWWYPGFFLAVIGFATSCTGASLYTREQLLGTDPTWDIVASHVLFRFRQTKPQPWSVKGVRLLDPIHRAETLWGKPSRIENQQGLRYIWTNAAGQILLRALVGQHESNPIKIIQQIDVFSAYRSALYPENRALLDAKQIESPLWRKKIFGSAGKIEQGSLDTRYIYPQQGVRLLVFSRLLPLQHNGSVVLTFYRTQTDVPSRVTRTR